MLKILIIILLFLVIFVWETSMLFRKKEFREIIVFSFLMLVGLALSIIAVFREFI